MGFANLMPELQAPDGAASAGVTRSQLVKIDQLWLKAASW